MFYLTSGSTLNLTSLQIRNSQSVQLLSTGGYTCSYHGIYCDTSDNSAASQISIDDCVFWLEDDVTGDFFLYEPLGRTIPTSLVSRSIHSYNATYNTSWVFTTGIDTSGGLGLLENYKGVQRPFTW
jgi:hypothetical protein